jgi:Flp pilus assembly pilin Flp
LLNEKGSTFIESGLWIALVVLVMAGAGVALANTMGTKFGQIEGVMDGITVPNP